MTLDPMRLGDGSSSALVRELLGHAKSDSAGEVVRQGAQKAAQEALSSVLAGTSASASFLASSLAKWLGLALAVGVVGAGVATTVAPPRAAEPVALPAPRPAPAAPPADVRRPESVSIDELPLAPAVSQKGLGGRGARPAPDGLEREIEILDRARRALAGGNASGALGELDEHATEFRVLGPEAQSLRIEALYAAGRTSEAVAFSNRFLASHSKSPLAARVLALKNAHEKAEP